MNKYQPYPDYQPVDIDWIDEIPSHWKTSKMRYMFSFGKGLTITKDNLKDDGIPCVNYGEVHSKFGFEVTPHKHALKCVDQSYLKSGSSSLLKKGDLIFADTSEDIDGSGNFTQLISDSPVFAGYHTIIARPYDRECYRFFAYLIDAKELRTQIRHAVKGVKVFSITQAILRSVNIWLPPLEERKQIAAFLDHETAKTDTLIQKQQQLIELLKEKRQAVISHAVTKGLNPNVPMKDSGVEWLGEVPEHWVVSPLKMHITTRKGVAFKSADFCSSGIRVVKASDIKQRTIKTSDVFLPNKFTTEYPKAILNEGEVVLSTVGSTPDVKNSAVGQIGKVPKELAGSLLNQNTVIFSPQSKILEKDFLFYLIQTNVYRDHLDLHAHGTANQASLSIADMLNFIFALPTIKEQQEISSYIAKSNDYFDLIEGNCNKAIALMQERRTALISAAVTGKIDVRNWVAPATSSDTNETQQEVTA
ncbi:restriction endonuclease subunit S [Photobacterium leiognathi]|uniref:restriction endonuclease subunit S n=1 Tax=Photobacterium leiognathi TaxID=553611 RepID=UPI002981EC27|nr:restriction endonuclease subunit S [Photobacterium leiognathi]